MMRYMIRWYDMQYMRFEILPMRYDNFLEIVGFVNLLLIYLFSSWIYTLFQVYCWLEC